MSTHSRRTLLGYIGLSFAGSLAGCMDQFTPSRETSPTDSSRESTPAGWSHHTSGTDGPVRWSVEYDFRARWRPVISDGQVFVGWSSPGESGAGALTSVAQDDGELQWHAELPRPTAGPLHVRGDDVYLVTGLDNGRIGSDQRLHRFSTGGAEMWRTYPFDGFLHLLAIGDDRAFLGTSHESPQASGTPLHSISLSSGLREWTIEPGDSTQGTYHGGRLLVDLLAGGFGAYDSSDGSERWRVDADPLGDVRNRLAVADGTAYVQSGGRIVEIDLQDGSTGWQFTPQDVRFTPTGAAVGDEHLVATGYGGSVFGVSRDDGTERWRVSTDGEARRRPLVVEDTVYVGDDRAVYALDVASGNELWQAETSGSVLGFDRRSEVFVTVSAREEGREVAAFDASDGTGMWRYETNAEVGGHAIGRDHVLVTEQPGRLVALGV